MLESLAIFAGLMAPLAVLRAQASGPSGAEIVFLNVGQGDAILIRSDTFNVLVDAGNSGHIMRDLLERNVHHIHLLVASHNHDDHIGDMDDVIRNITVDRIIENSCKEETLTSGNLYRAINRYGVDRITDAEGFIHFGSMNLEILPSPFMTCDTAQNNLSIGVVMRLGTFSALFTGDSEADELNAWMADSMAGDVDVLKAAHHGSRNGLTPGWLQWTKPEVVVISVGGEKSYGHPSASAMRYYRAGNRRVYRTDLDGTVGICIEPTGEYEVQTHLEASGTVCQ